MFCLTVRQPWAWAIFHGKDIENRDWPLPVKHRGRVVGIHAASGMTRREYDEGVAFCEQRGLVMPPMAVYERGAILGTVRILGDVVVSTSPWFIQGCHGFVLSEQQLFATPIAAKGALGFWWESAL